MEEFHHDGRNHEGNDEQQPDVLVDIVTPLTWQIRTLAKTLHEDEVGEGSEGDSTKDSDGIAGMLSVVEREDDTGNPHHECTENKGDDDRGENTHDYLQSLVAVEQYTIVEAIVTNHLESGKDESTSQQLEYQ